MEPRAAKLMKAHAHGMVMSRFCGIPNVRTDHGFSLLELMTVIAVLVILSVLVLPAGNSIARGLNMTDSADRVVGVLSLARQTALSSNHPVEVRFYQYGDPEVPGERISDPSSGQYRAVQLFKYDDAGTASAVDKMQVIPKAVIFSASPALSSLLDNSKPILIKSWSASDARPAIPRAGMNYNCCAFRFQTDGSTGLPTGEWFLTLQYTADGANRTTLPPNCAVIQVDPISGAIKKYRP